METLKSLYEKRARVHSQMKDVAKKWESEIAAGKEVDKEEERQFDLWNADYAKLEEQIQRLKKFEAIEGADQNQQPEKPEQKDRKAQYSEAFRNYVTKGVGSLTAIEAELMAENRAATASSTTVAAGGYTIPEDFSYILEKFMSYYGPFAGPTGPFYALTTNSGADMPWPVVDDTSNIGYLIAESGDITTSSTGVTFGVETLKAYAFTSGLVPVTRQLLQDSGFDFATILAGLLAERLGRAKNLACTTGTGSSQPEGCTIGSTQGKHTASATAFTPNEMIDFLYSVNNAYKMGPNVGWMMNPAILGAIRKLDVSTSNYTQPMFQPALSAGIPDRILGYPYWENSNMASTLVTGAKIMMFGDWSKFVIRQVKNIELLRSEERYLEFLQIAYLSWMRFDSRVINSSALKYLELT